MCRRSGPTVGLWVARGLLLVVVGLVRPGVEATVADYSTIPKGINPTLYSPDDHVVQLDESTFNDTVFCEAPDCPAYLVQFYSDWCGHCRAFAPLYKALARDVSNWDTVIRVAAMNCADAANQVSCRANGVAFFPYIKYFPRNSTDSLAGSTLRPFKTMSEMRDQLTKMVIDDYALNRFPDWPNFDFLRDVDTYTELWDHVEPNASFLAIVFENHPSSLTGAQLLLDLLKYRNLLATRRALKNHPLVEALHITDFPSLVIFRKGEKTPVVQAELRRLLFNEVEEFLGSPAKLAGNSIQHSAKRNATDDCTKNPEVCRQRYYVSEVDMLKALRYALLRETTRTGGALHGANLTALHSFVSLLAYHFPTKTTHEGLQPLDRSTAAVNVFRRLTEYIESKGLNGSITIDEWQSEFLAAEEIEGDPFPITKEWEHCRGSTRQLRGYSCGLWTTFHALTVNAFRNNGSHVQPQAVLGAIRGWVGEFFGCLHCREHFIRMTTKTFPIELQVRDPEDVFLYLWKAHNIVNNRLKGRDTEDPVFPKYQFPASFLCTNCSAGGSTNDDLVSPFLLQYYADIRPYTAPTESPNGN